MNRSTRATDIPWLRDIPERWEVRPFRHLFRESNEVNGPKPVGPMLSISGYRGVEAKVYESASLVRDDSQLEAYRVVRPGQLAVNTMWLNYAGLGVSDLLGHMSPAYRAYWMSSDLDSRFAHHLLRSSAYVQGYTALLTGIRPNSLQMSRADLMAFPVLVPPIREQRAIGDYLDRETAQIDAFIAKNEELIAFLKERRSAAVTNAVTAGLGSATQTIPTQSPVLGRIPEHWDVLQLRHLLVGIDQGVSPQADAGLASEGQWGVLKSGCVNGGMFRPEEHKALPTDYPINPAIVVWPGDLLVNRASGSLPLLGSAGIVSPSPFKLILSDKTFRLLPNNRVHTEYLYWWLNSRSYREQIAATVSGADGLANNLPMATLRGFVMPLPPKIEQAEIARHLSVVTAAADRAIQAARRAISLARERRAALISAAVTGKIDVGVAA